MPIKSGFFNAEVIQGVYDREYSAEDFAKCFEGFISDGIVGKSKSTSTSFEVIKGATGTNNVIVSPGYAWINGKWVESDEEITVEVPPPSDTSKRRFDVICLRCDYDERRFFIKRIIGEETTLPLPIIPDCQDDSHAKEIPLAGVYYNSSIIFIDDVALADLREMAHIKINSVDMTEYYNKTEIDTRLGGLSFERITKEDFDNLETKDPNTIYFVFDNRKIKQYLGDAELSSAGITAGTIIPNMKNNMAMIAGIITEV